MTEVHVLDMRSGDYLRESASSIVLAYAVRPDHRLERTMADELFGLFLVNESMTRITETIDVIETRAWSNYEMRLERPRVDSVVLVGRGFTYRDDPIRRAYKIAVH